MPFKQIVGKLELPSSWVKTLFLILLSAFFVNVGVDHFVNPEFYLAIMPGYLPLHSEAVYISGFFEILGGISVLIPRLRAAAGWGLVALLIAVFPANIHMAINTDLFPDISPTLLYIRLVLQFIFIYWAYAVTRPSR
ncbi:MAG: DoxX family protein [Porticoccaceae bacterium]|nr:DoxX family protein [Porticoccaceae bacterium]|tara:strand:- start:24 stop:434 length:411 start_codon:yes stop_codon:yes gene_type:complete